MEGWLYMAKIYYAPIHIGLWSELSIKASVVVSHSLSSPLTLQLSHAHSWAAYLLRHSLDSGGSAVADLLRALAAHVLDERALLGGA